MVNYKALLQNDLGHWADHFLAVLEGPAASGAWPQVRAAAGR
jgi:hypothetical protein